VLVPQEEMINEREGGQEDPPGFHVIPLPFVDDIRDPPKKMTYNLTGDYFVWVLVYAGLLTAQRTTTKQSRWRS
jgi:hypothetical protein